MRRFLIIVVVITGLFTLWFVVDKNKNFKERYRDLTAEQKAVFDWDTKDSTKELTQIFTEHFGDTTYNFPRQKVSKIRLFKNKSLFSSASSKTLKKEYIDSLVNYCNNPNNFDWGETTWSTSEAEYILRFYDNENYVVGKLFLCLKDCYRVEPRPFTPNMKFGRFSDKGISGIKGIISQSSLWN